MEPWIVLSFATVLLLVSNLRLITADDYACAEKFSSFPFCNTSLPTKSRVKDLVGRLTLQEKVHQLGNSAEGVARLGIPKYEWWSEALHGVSNTGPGTKFGGSIPAAVSFPQVILTAATFNTSLWKKIGEVISTEARAMYNVGQSGLTFWSPNINILRDPRWGRAQETPGEDPLVGSMYAVNFVQGLQSIEKGDSEKSMKVGACCKHFSAYDVDQWKGVDRYHFDAKVTEQDMQDTFQPPFQACVQEGEVACVMCSYNRINGVPTCASKNLLTDVVRNKWGLQGYVASDCDSVQIMYDDMHYTKEPENSVADTITAGLNLNCGQYLTNYTERAVQKGLLEEKVVDESLSYLYTTLMRLGYFNGDPKKQKWGNAGPDQVCTEENREVAVEAAKQGIVLLKNEGKGLPLSKDIKTIAVIGPNANNKKMMIGNYAGVPCRTITPLEGIARYANVFHVEGCSGGVACNETDAHEVDLAVAAATKADAVVLVMGLDQSEERESFDRSTLTLPDQQDYLISTVAAAAHGPVIVVIMSGGPIDISQAQSNPCVHSILWAGYPGEAGGEALAHVLLGHYNPTGRLPNTWYRENYTVWPMTDMRMRADPKTGYPGRTYRFYENSSMVLYDFGYGLSYTNFSYTIHIGDPHFPSNAPNFTHLDPSKRVATSKSNATNNHTCIMINSTSVCNVINVLDVSSCPTLEVNVEVTNQGSMDGGHATLLMWNPPNTNGTLRHALGAPIRQLIGFERAWIPARKSSNASFSLDPCKQLSLLALDGVTRVLPLGSHTLSIGTDLPSSPPSASLTFEVMP